MDDIQKIYLLTNEDGVKFIVSKILDFSHHKMLKEINNLRDNDWAHVHITSRTLTFGDKTFNLNSQLSMDITVPALTYGEPKTSNLDGEEEEDVGPKKTDEDDSEDEAITGETDWQIQSV